MVDENKKKEQADLIVDSLDELFPEEAQVETQPVGSQTTHKSQGGGVGVSVNGNKEIEYLRVPEKGSIEAVKLSNGKWAVTRRDKLPHNKQ